MKDLQQEVPFEVEGDDGRSVMLVIRPLNRAVRREIERATRKAYHEAIRAGYPTDEQAGPDNLALVGDREWEGLRETIWAGAEQLARTDLSLAYRHGIALAMREGRNRLETAVAAATRRKPTADSVAAQVQFESLVALSVYDATGRRLYRSPELYRRHARNPFNYRVAQAVGRVFYCLDDTEPTEERFLREHPLAS